jgi:hypothetical protein
VTQLSLLNRVERDERPRKTVRKVSRQQYAVLRDTNVLPARRHAVLTALAHYYNARAQWPTTSELVRWMVDHQTLTLPSANWISGRITELVTGRKVMGKDRSVSWVGGGVCEFLPARPCTITGKPAHPVRIREAGSILTPRGNGGTT